MLASPTDKTRPGATDVHAEAAASVSLGRLAIFEIEVQIQSLLSKIPRHCRMWSHLNIFLRVGWHWLASLFLLA